MKGSLRYLGEVPVHSLKLDWTPGMEVSLEKLYTLFGSKSQSQSADENFVTWFYARFRDKIQDKFEFILEDIEVSNDNSEDFEEEAQVTSPRSGSVNLEPSKVEVASSLKEAQDKLRNMRHPDVVGEIDIEKHEESSFGRSISKSQEMKNQKKLLNTVMTGDDLIQKRDFNSLVLADDGSARGVVSNNKERQVEDAANLANLSRKSNILTPDLINNDGSKSQVVVGDDSTSHSVGFKKSTVEGVDDNRRNKNFKGYQTFTSGRDVSPEEINAATSTQEAKQLIESCKDSTTLKVAMIHAKNNGNHKIRELLERRLRSLPPRG